jgi:transglutaminase-like putative cysteine protease
MTPEEATAIPHSEEPVDLIALSAVQLAGRLETDARKLTEITLKINGVRPDQIWHGPPLQERSDDRVTVRIPMLEELPALPVEDRSDPEWLATTPTIPATHASITQKAREVVGDATTRLEAVQRINQFVFDYVEKVPSIGVPNGLVVLQQARGDCNEHTALFVSLARASGIPSRIAAGVVYSDRVGEKGAFYYHAWPEVLLGGATGWVPVDPTFGQVPADASHVKIVEGDLDRQIEIMGVMGRLSFALVSAR